MAADTAAMHGPPSTGSEQAILSFSLDHSIAPHSPIPPSESSLSDIPPQVHKLVDLIDSEKDALVERIMDTHLDDRITKLITRHMSSWITKQLADHQITLDFDKKLNAAVQEALDVTQVTRTLTSVKDRIQAIENRHSPDKQPILEYKSISNLDKLGGQDVSLSLWKSRLENSLNGMRPLYSPLLRELIKSTETRLIEYDFAKACNHLARTHPDFKSWNGDNHTPAKVTWQKFNNDMWTILTEFTQAETLAKVKTANNLKFETVDVTQREQEALRNLMNASQAIPSHSNESEWKSLQTEALLTFKTITIEDQQANRYPEPSPPDRPLLKKTYQPTPEYEPDQGLNAYRNLHIWYNGITKQAINMRRAELMNPHPVQDHEVVPAIEKYERNYRELLDLGDSENEKISDTYRISALRMMLSTAPITLEYIRNNLSTNEYENDYDKFRSKVIEFATRIEKENKPSSCIWC